MDGAKGKGYSCEETPLLEARNLRTYFYTQYGTFPAVDSVSFTLNQGETLGIVGESGCGKTVTSLSVMRLIPNPPGRIVGGEILFRGRDLLKMKEEEMRDVRGNRISMIFQEPMMSLNPVFTVGDQIREAILLHQKIRRSEARTKTIDMLRMVGIPSPNRRIDEYPHQMSGGMRQRVMIAMALSCNPEILIADEPTTALDVTIQAQILDLIENLQGDLRMAIMLITHDLGVVAEIAKKVVVMYSGKIVEGGEVLTIFKYAQHPYTLGLIGSIPKLNENRARLQGIDGNVPDFFEMPKGCRFHPRCSYVREICKREEPDLIEIEKGHQLRCWLCAR